MEIGPSLVAALAILMLGAAVVNGVAGMGFAVVAVAVMAVLLEPKPAIVIMSLVSPVLTAMQIHHHWAFRDVTKRLPMLLLGAGVGAILGTQLLIVLPGYALAIALGLFAVWFAIDSWTGSPRTIRTSTERRLAPGVGLFAGLTNGSLGASGPILGSYLIAIGLRGRDFIFAISAVFATMAVIRIPTLALGGVYTTPVVLLGLAMNVPAYFGQRAGFWLQGKLSPVRFQQAILLTLFVAGAYLLYTGIGAAIGAMTG